MKKTNLANFQRGTSLTTSLLGSVCLVVAMTACSHTPPKDGTPMANVTVQATPTPTPAPSGVPFIPHNEKKPMQSYLAMNLPNAPYEKMQHQLEALDKIQLKSRGEAHITVITPVEYDRVLSKKIKIDEINKIAEEANIESIPFNVVCIGRGEKTIAGKKESTYYAIVESPGLMELRGKIESLYIEKGGSPMTFVPERFSPHITLGYTLRDLHFEDGVLKNKKSCVHSLKDLEAPAPK